jgi:hypothetical protein
MGESDYIQAKKHSIFNSAEIARSETCGCYYCLSIFRFNQIEEWVDEEKDKIGQTALCPTCGIDAVIGSASGYSIDQKFLEQMQQYWFGLGVPSFFPSVFTPKSFPSLSRQTKKLTITSDGMTLLHSASSQIGVWDIEKQQLRYSLPGSLVGVSIDGKTFLTRHIDEEYLRKDVATLSGFFRKEIDKNAEPSCTFKVWETKSGSELDLEKIVPETYQPYQRVSVFANRLEPALRIKELLGKDRSSKEITLYFDGLIENWMMTPDNRHIVLVYYVSAGGFDATVGQCVDATTGKAAYEFEASSTADSLPKIYFSTEHKLMISNHTGSFDIYELETGEHLHHISCFDEAPHRVWGICFAVNPIDKRQLAISYGQEPYTYWDEELRQKRRDWRAEDYINSVVISSVNDPLNEARVITILKQRNPIDDVEFFPGGERIAVLLSSGDICIWNIKTRDLLTTLSTNLGN